MSRNANRRDLTRRGTKKLIRKVVEDLSGGGGLVGNVQSKAAIPASQKKQGEEEMVNKRGEELY